MAYKITNSIRSTPTTERPILSPIMSCLYCLFDEFLQSFVSGQYMVGMDGLSGLGGLGGGFGLVVLH